MTFGIAKDISSKDRSHGRRGRLSSARHRKFRGMQPHQRAARRDKYVIG